jgi:hypothetical protein
MEFFMSKSLHIDESLCNRTVRFSLGGSKHTGIVTEVIRKTSEKPGPLDYNPYRITSQSLMQAENIDPDIKKSGRICLPYEQLEFV